MNVNLSNEVVEMLKQQVREGQTLAEVAEQAIKLGCYQLEYRRGPEARATRKAYQDKQRKLNKLAREAYQKAQQDPELAVKLGLGTRPQL